MNCDNK